ncbi:hypothetical protein AAFF_G00052380 [Aldrovandia affinis]|uniref:Hypocretin neuropeptide precursor n=1 Tax=Aldrovandia affinis TaxID=143900 RepID=A0AAD7T4U9_9TELE|nr:hypothetical protein AAFF_G00052380 [Aldrovandia affinis]
MESSAAKKILAHLLLVVLLCLSCYCQDMQTCCKQKSCHCCLYELLHGTGNHAAGILTLGKRKSSEQRYQSRLYQLLHASKNQAAGILTMGKRAEPDHGLYAHSTLSPLTGVPHPHSDVKPCGSLKRRPLTVNAVDQY